MTNRKQLAVDWRAARPRQVPREVFSFVNGLTIGVHDLAECDNQERPCVLHSPSEHSMRDWPMLLRETTLVERLCQHGIGHPDPDSYRYLNEMTGQESWGIHGCDGCCADRAEKS